MTDLEMLDSKISILRNFAANLRGYPENPNNAELADAVDGILRAGSSEDIDAAFQMCETKFSEV